MTETETRYAQIEKEALATTWACEKFSTYVLGSKFLIETDHKPLVPLLGSKNIDNLPPRILDFDSASRDLITISVTYQENSYTQWIHCLEPPQKTKEKPTNQ